MAEFEVLIDRIDFVENHGNADRLSVYKVRGFQLIGAKLDDGSHRYNIGDLVIYVPEGAEVPEYLLRQGFWDETKEKGFLAGAKGNIVRTVKLRGLFSTGIMFPVNKDNDYYVVNENGDQIYVNEGDNVAEVLGITKYEAPIPTAFAGEVLNLGTNNTFKFDVENYLKYKNVFKEGDEVFVKPKYHGTFCVLGWTHYDLEDLPFNHTYVSSKGMFAQGLVFKDSRNNWDNNLYMKTLQRLDGFYKLHNYIYKTGIGSDITNYYILGEVYGTGVQDLTYGEKVPTFGVFNIVKKYKNGQMYWFTDAEVESVCGTIGLQTIKSIYSGPFDEEKIAALRLGKEPDGTLREGIVINSVNSNDRDDNIGRKQLKFINPEYHTRKGGSEHQ